MKKYTAKNYLEQKQNRQDFSHLIYLNQYCFVHFSRISEDSIRDMVYIYIDLFGDFWR